MNARKIGAFLALIMAVSACGGSSSEPSSAADDDDAGAAVPIHSLTSEDGIPTGDLEAELVLDNSCLLLQGEGSEPLLAVWPQGTTFANNLVSLGETTIQVGERHTFGGGEVPVDAPALEGTDLPGSCTYGGIWLIAE